MKAYPTISFVVIFFLLLATAQAQDIIEASKAGDLAAVKSVLEGASHLVDTTDETGRTPLHWAARGVHVEVLSYLIDAGADVNSQDVNLVTPLHSICSRGHVEAARILIDKNANLSSTMFDQSTLLHLAVINGNAELISLLVTSGAPVGFRDIREDSPLRLAVHLDKWDAVDLIVGLTSSSDTGALNSADFDGNSILHLASGSRRMETVKTLISKRVDTNLRNRRGQSAYNIAIDSGFGEIAGYLVQHGATADPQRFPKLTGPYLGQEPPDTIPQLFAKGIVSTRIGMYGTIVFSPDGREAFWKPEYPKMLFTEMEGDLWTTPQVFPYEGKINVPFYSIDGERLYVMVEPQAKEEIWYFTRNGEEWTRPEPLDSVINSISMHWQFSLDRIGNVYFSGNSILCARFVDGEYLPPEPLPAPISAAVAPQEQYREGLVGPCISPEGDFLIFTKFSSDRQFPIQLYVSFRDESDSWTEPQSLGDRLRTEGNDSAARISRDGKYLFFQSVRRGRGASRGLYWVSTKVLDGLRPMK